MTRNISQWKYSATITSSPNSSIDEHNNLFRHSYKSLINSKQRRSTASSALEHRQLRCVSWAPDTSPILANLTNSQQQQQQHRDYRRKVTRSWYSGQSCQSTGGGGTSPKVGLYGSFTSTTVADSNALLSAAQSQPLLSTSHKTGGNIQKQKTTIQNKQSQRPPPSSNNNNNNNNNNNSSSIKTPQITITTAADVSPSISPLPIKKTKTARARGIDLIMPGLRSLVNRRTSGSTTSLTGLNSDSYNKTPTIVVDGGSSNGLRKCETAITLSTASSKTTLLAEPIPATNRLRAGTLSSGGLCSRCSSLLSLATSGSRYSLNAAAATFVPVPPVLCKLCLTEVSHADTCTLQQCSCSFCKHCMQAYINFEIIEGAYDISCPDAQCPAQGIITLVEIERLVESTLVEKHKKYRLNREVDIDKNRTWCPRAGCETVCTLCPSERCSPQSVHCPTCSTDFCSNCKQPWHGSTSCEEQARLLGNDSNLGIPFDSDLIKYCPMCNVPIEKDEGCAQMMCKRCKHVFCWYCLTSLDDDFLLRHYDKGPCKNKLGHSRASVIWHRTQVIGIFAGFGILLLVASPLLLLAAPCIVCCKCRVCNSNTKLDNEDELPEESAS